MLAYGIHCKVSMYIAIDLLQLTVTFRSQINAYPTQKLRKTATESSESKKSY